MGQHCPPRLSRRTFLSSVAFTILAGTAGPVLARSFRGGILPWTSYAADPPVQVTPGGWHFFTAEEAATVEAIVDRLIPPDDITIGGKEAGCAVYIDRQLAGPFGNSSRLYTQGPFLPGLPTQGYQGEAVPAARYRSGLDAIKAYLMQNGGTPFTALSPEQQDTFLTDLEAGRIALPHNIDGKGLFTLILNNTMEGFFADPVYGGNRDMVSWRMLGFPGARYDYRDHVSKHNQPYPRPPVSIAGAPEWLAQ
ncbi:gluconate 2-dehydrogenase subunit 3 family protein [Rhizobiaceae bacterium BDR2-2]|uniref:Gluconate 2-dehydrogenase subunit 3 family protein n=1 Tax=Ectorhizobium quercum TaxID=2965071 RepID=A0AAE3N2J4_9HYPH|nr:gluconate 2-dehydrogenase subunit 3 family protein [Ectorhizobium quercum]MCX8999394.1 gluconate 2-dehydrogenase subunit 3 family protein [Ectorhizobium quercum]